MSNSTARGGVRTVHRWWNGRWLGSASVLLSPTVTLPPGLPHKNALAFLHPEVKEQALMVKRRKEEDIAGVLEFEGRTAQDPEFMDWVADHRKQNGGTIRVSKGWKGVRGVFSKEGDLTLWKARSERAGKGKKSAV
jgi:hypothetical protein